MTDPNTHPTDAGAEKPSDEPARTHDAADPDGHHHDEELPPEPIVLATPDDPDSNDDWYLWAGVLVLIALGGFLPAVTGQFLSATDRQLAAGLDGAGAPLGFLDIWTNIHSGSAADPQYHPFTLAVYWILHGIWSGANPNPVGFRAATLVLHAAAVVLLWRLLRRLTVPGAFVIAAFWAIHPVQAETLGTISQMKTVLAGLLSFGSIWFFFDFADVRPPADDSRQPAKMFTSRNNALIASMGLFVLAVLSLPAMGMLPIAILPILFWKNRADKDVLIGLVPLIAVGLAAGLMGVVLEHGATSRDQGNFDASFIERMLIAARCVWFYLGKILLPIGLSAMYPKWPANDPMLWVFFLAILAMIGVLFSLRKSIGMGPLAGAAWFGIMLVPHLGLLPLMSLRHTNVVDHFQYLPSVGPLALVISGVAVLFQYFQDRQPQTAPPEQLAADGSPALPGSVRLAMLLTIAVLVILGVDTWIRSDKFASAVDLWSDAIKTNKDPSLWPAHRLLALALNTQAESELAAGDLDEARATWANATSEFKIVLQDGSDTVKPEVLTDLGSIYLKLHDPQDAAVSLQKAADLIAANSAMAEDPVYYGTYFDLGSVLDQVAGQKNPPDYAPATAALEHAAKLLFSVDSAPTPEMLRAKTAVVKRLASAYFHSKQYSKAATNQAVVVLQLDPNNPEESFLLAEYLAWDGQLDAARAAQKATLQNCFNLLHTIPASYLDFMGVLEMNQTYPEAKIATALFADAAQADPANTLIAAHLAAAKEYGAWAASTQPSTQPTTQSAIATTMNATTVPTTKPALPADFTVFLNAGTTTAPTTQR